MQRRLKMYLKHNKGQRANTVEAGADGKVKANPMLKFFDADMTGVLVAAAS